MKQQNSTEPGSVCAEARFWESRLFDYADGCCTAEEAASVEAHLAGCAACRTTLAEIRRMSEALKDCVPDPGEALTGAVMAAIGAAQTGACTTEPAEHPEPRPAERSRRLGYGIRLAGGIAAAFLLTVGVIRLVPLTTRNTALEKTADCAEIHAAEPDMETVTPKMFLAPAADAANGNGNANLSQSIGYAANYESEAVAEHVMEDVPAEIAGAVKGESRNVTSIFVYAADRAKVAELLAMAAAADGASEPEEESMAESLADGWHVTAEVLSAVRILLEEAGIPYTADGGAEPDPDADSGEAMLVITAAGN